MAEEENAAGWTPAGPFLREYRPVGPFQPGGAKCASVLFYGRGGYSVATVAGVTHHGKPKFGKPHTVCEIALGTFTTELTLDLPASGGATFFKAEVEIHWSVTDPYLAATEVVTDVAQRLTAPTLERLRRVSSQFAVDQAEEADRKITSYCTDGRWDDLGSEIGLRVRLYVRLKVDDQVIAVAAKRREQDAEAELATLRQARFRDMLRGGQLEQLSYILASSPQEANAFMEKIRQEGRQDDKERVDRLFQLIERDKIHVADVESQVVGELSTGPYRISGAIGSLPRREEPAAEHRDEPYTPSWALDEPADRPADRRTDRPADRRTDRAGTERAGTDEDAYRVPEDDRQEPPRRRPSEDDGWSWVEED